MSEFLTPAEVDKWVAYTDHSNLNGSERYAATLREMAEICEAMAEMDITAYRTCPCCHSSWYVRYWTGEAEVLTHTPECVYGRARNLRGKS